MDVLLRPIILVVLLSFRLSFGVFYFFSLSVEFCECSPCVHREHRFLFGDVGSGSSDFGDANWQRSKLS